MERTDITSSSHGNERAEKYISNDPEDIPVLNSISEKIDGLHPLSNDCCIFRVPKRLRDVNEKAFTPQIVSIGPFHRGKKHLQVMEKDKLRYLKSFLNRTDGMSLKSCIRVVKQLEEDARSYYAEIIMLPSDEFVEMILLDSCFIIEVICRFNDSDFEKQNDYLDKQIFMNDFHQDLILIENQLPFFVLERIFNLSISSPNNTTRPFLMLSINYLEANFFVSNREEPFSSGEIKHFVDLLRLCLLPSSLRSPARCRVKYVPIRTATELREAGMEFWKGSSNCLLDIARRSKGELEIPQLTICAWTESFFLNLMALEQFHYLYDSYIIDYIHFMDNLIDTAKDANLLIQRGIFVNCLGESSAVASLFNKLTPNVTLWSQNYYFCDISIELNNYCNDPCQKWKATLRRWKATLGRDYFSTPWSVASTIAAVILLGLTLTQTICAIVSL
ncbi:UPF0481 protein At3g47200-like isoform X1 [Cornus florida]|uniref:UPF0481 protein At3g47200-like isoform X1 n=1 Tax=Cornus florida TaxID=4283 RepID=UPI00289BB79C|nr:UPF0481 protein At3g47200-like isoform X1 [Cornus florida]XP_059642063.1 UPF0481 protein At3g47200-like isoform X1 [Cornus florida]